MRVIVRVGGEVSASVGEDDVFGRCEDMVWVLKEEEGEYVGLDKDICNRGKTLLLVRLIKVNRKDDLQFDI